MRNDRKKREIQRERERDSSPAEEDEREMKIGEGGRGGQKKCKPKLRNEREEAPFSSALPFLSLILLFAQGMHGTRKGNGSKRMRETNGESGRSLPCLTFFVPLTSSSHSSDTYSCQKSVERSEFFVHGLKRGNK